MLWNNFETVGRKKGILRLVNHQLTVSPVNSSRTNFYRQPPSLIPILTLPITDPF